VRGQGAVRFAIKTQRGPARVVAVAPSQSEHAVARAESAVAHFQVQAPQQRRKTVADEILRFLDRIGRGGQQDWQPFEQSRLAPLHVLGSSALADAPIRGVSSSEALAARGVEESIADERRLLAPVRDQADLLIDTGELNTNQLRSRVLEAFSAEGGATSMRTSVVSFGYKYGLPLDVDVVFDCRFLPNPFWIEELRPFSGLDEPVREYVLSQPETKDFLEKVDGLLTGILPSFVREGKSYLTIALGCTGGRHRSVALAEALGERIGAHGHQVSVFHRDVER